MIREKQPKREIIIDLTGPEGNAFYLLGTAKKLARQIFPKDMGFEKKIIEEMQSGDYEHLLEVFDSYFGEFVILER
jgi:hypothetical protein